MKEPIVLETRGRAVAHIVVSLIVGGLSALAGGAFGSLFALSMLSFIIGQNADFKREWPSILRLLFVALIAPFCVILTHKSKQPWIDDTLGIAITELCVLIAYIGSTINLKNHQKAEES
jgi:hypothetical protein